MRKIKVSPLMELRLKLMNVIAGLTKHEKDEGVYNTAVQLTEWADRDSTGKPMHEGKDYVTTAKNMIEAAKGEKQG